MKSTQRGVILRLLREAHGSWVDAWTLAHASGSLAVHTQIDKLRRDGFSIENECPQRRGKAMSRYRLIPPKQERLECQSSRPQTVDTSQGSLAIELPSTQELWPD